jgi:phosphatidylinositol mannoside-binding LppM-like protein
MRAGNVKLLLGVAVLALLLTGCFRVNFDLEVSPENTVAGTAVIAVDQDLLELSGQSVDQFFNEADLSDLPANASIDDYEEDGFVGKQVTFDQVPLDEFQQNETLSGGGTGGESLSIEREGDEFVVSGGFDMSGPEFTGQDVPQQFLDNFEFRITMTFPGPVTSSTGQVDGNTVTWEPKFGENTRIEARASAIPSTSSPWLMILLIAGGALLLGGLVYVLTHRAKPAPAMGPDDGTATPVDPSVAAATPIEAPPPPADTGLAGDAPPPPAPMQAPSAPIESPPAPTQPVPPAAPEPPTEPIAPEEPAPGAPIDPDSTPEGSGEESRPEDEPPPAAPSS